MIKKLGLALAGLTAAVALASCGGGGNAETGGGGNYTIFLVQEGVVYNQNMPVFQAANEYAGFNSLTGILQNNDTNYDSTYQLRGKYASIVVNDQDTIEATALREGLYADLTDLIAEYAPNLTAYWNANPEKKEWATASDGAIYGVPFYTDGETAKGYFIRMDWVEKLAKANKLPAGLQATEASLNSMTVEQFHDLLLTFKQNQSIVSTYNSGEIYPYFDRDADFAISELASLWGATADYYLDDNGTVHYGIIEESMHEALNNIIQWYSEGLIDPQILTDSTEDKRVTYFSYDNAGATHDWIGTTYSFNSEVYASNLVEDFKVVCILPPERADGTRYEPTARHSIGNVTAVNADLSVEDQIQIVKWIDFFFSEEGQDLANYGVKDTHYKVADDGSYVYTDAIVNDNNTALANLYNVGAQLQVAGIQDFAYEEAWLSDEAAAAMAAYSPYLNTGYNELIYPNIKLESSTYNSVNAARSAIDNTFSTNVATWLRRGTPISDSEWSQFVAQINRDGAQTVITAIQNAYNAKN